MRMAWLPLLALLWLVSGCELVPLTTGAADKSARVYIYRDQVAGNNQYLSLAVNGREFGRTGPRTYFEIDLPAGVHSFSSRQGESDLNLVLEAGGIYYIRQQVFMSFTDISTLLYQVGSEEGAKTISGLRALQSLPYAFEALEQPKSTATLQPPAEPVRSAKRPAQWQPPAKPVSRRVRTPDITPPRVEPSYLEPENLRSKQMRVVEGFEFEELESTRFNSDGVSVGPVTRTNDNTYQPVISVP